MNYGLLYAALTALGFKRGGGGGSVTPSDATPQAPASSGTPGTSTAYSRGDHAHIQPTSAQINAQSLPINWNPVTNTPTLAAGVAPGGNNTYKATVGGSTAYLAADGISSVAVNDEVVFNGTNWVLYQYNSIGYNTLAILKGNNNNGATDAVRGSDYAEALVETIPVPVIYASLLIGANGAFMVGYPGSTSGTVGGTVTFSGGTTGAGITCTASLAIFAGTAANDTGKVISLPGGITFTVTGNSGSSTTIVQGTIAGGSVTNPQTFAANTWALGMALDQAYTAAWFYVNANAINGSNAAGFYYGVMSSALAGTLSQQTYTPGTAGSWQFPATPTAWSGTTGAASLYAALAQAAFITVPANAMGISGCAYADGNFKTNGGTGFAGAGSKVIRAHLGLQNIAGITVTAATAPWVRIKAQANNVGVANKQTAFGLVIAAANGGNSGAVSIPDAALLTVATTAAQTVDFTVQINSGNGFDWVVCDFMSFGYGARAL